MGTNYYLQEETCAHCGRGPDKLHIGKSSAGWCFALHIIPEIGLTDLDAWRERWNRPGAVITDEYDDIITPEKMESNILNRSWKGSELGSRWFALNHAAPGPNGLARHEIGRYCAGHGNGTYDLMLGEFS